MEIHKEQTALNRAARVRVRPVRTVELVHILMAKFTACHERPAGLMLGEQRCHVLVPLALLSQRAGDQSKTGDTKEKPQQDRNK